MNLVVGATGVLGIEICRQLAAAGLPVRGLVRPTSAPDRVAELKAIGVQCVMGDLRQQAAVKAACYGVQAVISSASCLVSRQPGDSILETDQQGQFNLVQSARAAGVEHFVLVGILPGLRDCPLADAKQVVAQALQGSGMAYTILRPGFFMETWLSPALGFDCANHRATIYGEGHVANSYISSGDVARIAVESLSKPAARNATFEIGLPTLYSQLEVVRAFEQVSGKCFELKFVPAAVLAAQRAAATDTFQESFATLIHQVALGTWIASSAARRVFRTSFVSMEDYARRVMGSL